MVGSAVYVLVPAYNAPMPPALPKNTPVLENVPPTGTFMLPLNWILPATMLPANVLGPCTHKSPVIPTPPPPGTTMAPVV